MMPAIFDIFTGVAVGAPEPEGDPACLAEALRLLNLGYWPVAIYPPDSTHLAAGKAPIGRAWGATRPTEESLREVWSRHPGASVGLKLGREAGVIDVEVDDPETGEESLAGLLGGELVETLGWSSARGSHNLFAWDERLLAFDKSIYKPRDFPGVEIRLGHGEKQLQSVCPPSPVTREVGGRVVAGEPREWIDFPIAPIPAALIRALESAKAEPQPAPEPPRADPFAGTTSSTSSNNRPDAEQRALLYLQRCQPAVSGEAGHNQAFKAACKIGPGFNLPTETAFQLLWRHWNHLCKPPWSERELRHKVEDAYKEEPRRGFLFEQDRHKPGSQGATAGASAQGGSPPPEGEAEEQPRELELHSFADLEAVPIEWLAPGRIPMGKLVLLAGPGGLGKSTLTLDIAARLTRGLPLFDEPYDDEADIDGPASVLLVASEDDAADTQLPRFLAAGGDPSRISQIVGVRGSDGKIQPFSIADLEPIHQTLLKRPDVRIVIIDPIAAYMGRAKVDDHKNSELSAIFQPLNTLAARHKVTFLMIAHFNKSTSATAVNRVMGGAAYGNSVRAVFVVVADPDNEGLRVVSSPKFNLGPTPNSIAYRIRSLEPDHLEVVLEHKAFAKLNDKQRGKMSRQLARIHWEGESAVSADDCLAGGTPKSRMGPKPRPSRATTLEECRQFIVKTLEQAGGELPSKELKTLVTEAGFTDSQMHDDEVKYAPRIRLAKRGFGPNGKWWWVLQPEPQAEEGPVF